MLNNDWLRLEKKSNFSKIMEYKSKILELIEKNIILKSVAELKQVY